MSLILDALRRADAERQRDAGAPPGLGAPVAPSWDEETRPRSAGKAVWVGGALLLLAAGGLAWWLTAAPGPATSAPVVAAAAPAAITPPAPPVEPPPPAPQAPPEAPLPPMSLRLPDVPPVPAAAPRVVKPAPRAASAASVPAAAAAAPVARLADLPPDQRRQWPALVVGGSMYSENLALRMVILDGQLLHEGDSAGPGVVVERIKPRSAVLRAGGQRVEVGW